MHTISLRKKRGEKLLEFIADYRTVGTGEKGARFNIQNADALDLLHFLEERGAHATDLMTLFFCKHNDERISNW